MNKLEEFEKKIQQLKEKNRKINETVSLLKTEDKILKKEIKEKNILLDNSPAGIVLIWRGRILEVNDAFLEYMGYKAEEMKNRNFLNFVHPDHLSEVRFIHNRWSAGKINRGHYDTWLITENDDVILCSIESKRIRYRGRASYILNITRLENRENEQKKIRQEIKSSTEIKMINGFKILLKNRSDTTHDLLRYFRDVKKGHNKGLEPVIEILKNEQENIQRETGMLEAIISEKAMSKDIKVIAINQIVNETVGRISSIIKSGEINIKTFLRASSSINVNPRELTEALIQILLTSISNMNGTGDIHITTEENTEKVYLYIQDSGIPVKKDKIESVFELFSAGETSLVHPLGMRFVKAVVQRHNGEIEYLPGRDQGNIYQIILPVHQEVKKRKKIDRNKLKKARVLIIQTDDIAKELLAHLLMEKGCSVERTGSSIEGLVALKKKKINMLIADIESLSMNLPSFLKKCRQINPGLITVGLGAGKGKMRSEDEGPDLKISKPFNMKEAVKKILELFMVKY